MNSQDKTKALFEALKLELPQNPNGDIEVRSPIDGETIAKLHAHTSTQINTFIDCSHNSFLIWRNVPAPKRGEFIRLFGEQLRIQKENLGALISIECGKIHTEGLGEVQEMIDICDFAVGLSRQLYGLTISSERPDHALRENWHPLGVIAVISAFNFPMAVWAWNTALALVCGNCVIWKPSEKTPLCALACQKVFKDSLEVFCRENPSLFPDPASEEPAKLPSLLEVVIGEKQAGELLATSTRIPLVSATGSCKMGKAISTSVASRFGKSILELGGNNAIIVCPSADLNLACQAIVFGAVGTAGQRCTSTRRVFVHDSIAGELFQKLKRHYEKLAIGDPLDPRTLVGPLIDRQAFDNMQLALEIAQKSGDDISGGHRVNVQDKQKAYYVQPALIKCGEKTKNSYHETFAPILYYFSFKDLDQAIHLQNDVTQGLSSAIFTKDLREAEHFLSHQGSDCGIANVNVGTSGAEIGGAFGGEKETGGGRESGTDAWKGYMRRSTNTINYSNQLPLAQGLNFNIE